MDPNFPPHQYPGDGLMPGAGAHGFTPLAGNVGDNVYDYMGDQAMSAASFASTVPPPSRMSSYMHEASFSTDPNQNSLASGWASTSYPTLSPYPPALQELPRPTLQPSISHSTNSDVEEVRDPQEPSSPTGDASERRRERRRAQNRAAQRAFRARKEGTIKEVSSRLETLQAELYNLQSARTGLTGTVAALRGEIARLEAENANLKSQMIVQGQGRDSAFTKPESDGTHNEGSQLSTDFEAGGGTITASFGAGMSFPNPGTENDREGNAGGGDLDHSLGDAAEALGRGIF